MPAQMTLDRRPVDENKNIVWSPDQEKAGVIRSVATWDAFGNHTYYEFIEWDSDEIEWLDDPSDLARETAAEKGYGGVEA